jgi:hypothetical protein
MTDISSLQKYLTEQPDLPTIHKMDLKTAAVEAKAQAKAEAIARVKQRTAADRARRNIKD